MSECPVAFKFTEVTFCQNVKKRRAFSLKFEPVLTAMPEEAITIRSAFAISAAACLECNDYEPRLPFELIQRHFFPLL